MVDNLIEDNKIILFFVMLFVIIGAVILFTILILGLPLALLIQYIRKKRREEVLA